MIDRLRVLSRPRAALPLVVLFACGDDVTLGTATLTSGGSSDASVDVTHATHAAVTSDTSD
ncbi:MAG: hypothetical protein KC468_29125, partial [Myxococcales bacterium]|nr:hypothetical protein [Myxococcales bacterium]